MREGDPDDRAVAESCRGGSAFALVVKPKLPTGNRSAKQLREILVISASDRVALVFDQEP